MIAGADRFLEAKVSIIQGCQLENECKMMENMQNKYHNLKLLQRVKCNYQMGSQRELQSAPWKHIVQTNKLNVNNSHGS